MDLIAAILADPNIHPAFQGAMAAQAVDQNARPVRRARYVADLLKADWAFESSDDPRVWRAGRAELERLRAERAAIDADHALWTLHAHPDFRHG